MEALNVFLIIVLRTLINITFLLLLTSLVCFFLDPVYMPSRLYHNFSIRTQKPLNEERKKKNLLFLQIFVFNVSFSVMKLLQVKEPVQTRYNISLSFVITIHSQIFVL
jgi:hypothetical protein